MTPNTALSHIGPFELLPCAVADVEHFHPLLLLQHAVYRAVNMRLVAVQQMPEFVSLRRHRASVRLFLQAENRLLEPQIPFQGCVRMFSVNLPVQVDEIALRRGR